MFQIGIILLIVVGAFFGLEWAGKRFGRRGYMLFLWFVFAIYVLGNLYFTLLSRTPGTETKLTLLPFQSYARMGGAVPAEAEEAAGFAAMFLRGTTPLDGIRKNVPSVLGRAPCLAKQHGLLCIAAAATCHILARRHGVSFSETSIEVACVRKAAGVGDFGDGFAACALQFLRSLLKPVTD